MAPAAGQAGQGSRIGWQLLSAFDQRSAEAAGGMQWPDRPIVIRPRLQRLSAVYL